MTPYRKKLTTTNFGTSGSKENDGPCALKAREECEEVDNSPANNDWASSQ